MNVNNLRIAALAVSIFFITSNASAAPDCSDPKHASKPVCQTDGDPGGDDAPVPSLLEFEPRFGSANGRGLLTFHRNHGIGPDDDLLYDWSGRSCSGAYPSIGSKFPIQVERSKEGGAFVFRGAGPDLIIDLVAPEVTMERICGVSTLDGCFDSTNGQFTYVLRKTGKGRNKVCEVQFSWDFGYCEQGGDNEYIKMSTDWIAIDTDPDGGRSGDCYGEVSSAIDVIPVSPFTFTLVVNGVPQNNNSRQADLSFWLSRHEN